MTERAVGFEGFVNVYFKPFCKITKIHKHTVWIEIPQDSQFADEAQLRKAILMLTAVYFKAKVNYKMI